MSNEELEEVTDLLINTVIKSELNNYTKIELMINLRLFFENYDENIRLLNKERKDKNARK